MISESLKYNSSLTELVMWGYDEISLKLEEFIQKKLTNTILK